MPYRIEITLNPDLVDAEGEGVCQQAQDYFGIELESVRAIHVVTIDANLSEEQVTTIQTEILTNPVTQISSLDPLSLEFDWTIWVGYRPGVKDNPGSTATEAVEDLLGLKFDPGEAIYTSKRYCLRGYDLSHAAVDKIAGELLANDIIQQWKIYSKEKWDSAKGIGFVIPKVILDHQPTVTTVPIENDATLKQISDERNLALNPNDIPTIRAYFLKTDVQAARRHVGLSDPTDLELEP